MVAMKKNEKRKVIALLAQKYGKSFYEISTFVNSSISLDIDGVYQEVTIDDISMEDDPIKLYTEEIDKLLEANQTLKVKFWKYPYSKKFHIVDTIGVPHPYCITPRHLKYAHITLGEKDIKRAEEHGAKCGMEGCTLSYDEHNKVLLVLIKGISNDEPINKVDGLRDYLMSIKDMAESDGYDGFSFITEESWKKSCKATMQNNIHQN